MMQYHKIQSVFKRDKDTHKFTSEYSRPEFKLLKDISWVFTEKVDGTNIRIVWDGKDVHIKGRTANSQIPTFLYDKLKKLFPISKLEKKLSNPLCLYGEGYGAKIQKGGGKYISNDVNFVLFDVRVDDWWLQRDTVEEIAKSLDISAVPIIGIGTIQQAIDIVKGGLQSKWGDFIAEGLVLKPEIDIFNRKGNRIITKIKHKDF